jgi:hypothetical protein
MACTVVKAIQGGDTFANSCVLIAKYSYKIWKIRSTNDSYCQERDEVKTKRFLYLLIHTFCKL